MSVQEPALLNAVLAVAASHHSRWQHTADKASRKYLRAAARALRDRFATPSLVHSQVTLASMLLLVTFEVFSGSSRWKGHYDAIRGWIRSRGDCSDLDPFLKTWVCLLDTQSALNLGEPAMPELESWLDMAVDAAGQQEYVDALFGCSSKLPKLMVSCPLTTSQLPHLTTLLSPVGSSAPLRLLAQHSDSPLRTPRPRQRPAIRDPLNSHHPRFPPPRRHLLP